MEDGESALAVGRESVAGRRVEPGAIHTVADRNRRDPYRRIEHPKQRGLRCGTRWTAVMCRVDGHGNRMAARRSGQRRFAVAVLASISTPHRYRSSSSKTLPSPADAAYSGFRRRMS